jgi:hypothetical protein
MARAPAREAAAPAPAEARAGPAGWRARLPRLGLPGAAIWVIVPLAIALLSWQALPLEPGPGLENSWHAALHMALHDGISFGNHLIFTYGPLGFLSAPTLWYSDTGTIAVIYALLVRIALAAAAFAGARRSYGTLGGAMVALLVVGASGLRFEHETPSLVLEELPALSLEIVPFLVFSVWVVDRVADRRRLLVFLGLAGAIAGVELLNKVSVGLAFTVLTVITALAARGRRGENLIVSLGALIVALLASWAATGQSLGALPAYVHSSAQIGSGYAAAMSWEEAGLGWQYPVGAVAFAFGLAAALHMTADDGSRRRRWGIVALWIAFCYLEFKEAFVRHDQIHGPVYFVALLVGFLAFRWRGAWRLVGFGLTGALLAFVLLAQDSSVSALFDPNRAGTAIDQLGEVFNPAERDAITARGRAAIEAAYRPGPVTLGLLEGKTVHVAPYQTSVVWAYELDWRPLPVFQSYAAYTTGLDETDADALSSPRAPQRILRNLDPSGPRQETRVQAFDEGLATRTILCRYVELRTTPDWQVLGLGPNRCQTPVPLTTFARVRADWGQVVQVPPPPNDHSFVFVRISGVGVGGFERLTALLYRPAVREIVFDGVAHRLREGTAADGLILRAAPGADFTPPFNIAPNALSIEVTKAGQGRSGGLPLTFSFFAQSVTAGPRSASLQRAIIHHN